MRVLEAGDRRYARAETADDIRDQDLTHICTQASSEGAVVTAHDPVAIPGARARIDMQDIAFAKDLEQAVEGADAVVIVTRWQQFDSLPDILTQRERQPLIVDGRRMLARDSVAHYAGIGLGTRAPRGRATRSSLIKTLKRGRQDGHPVRTGLVAATRMGCVIPLQIQHLMVGMDGVPITNRTVFEAERACDAKRCR